jgi:hypothetical protein
MPLSSMPFAAGSKNSLISPARVRLDCPEEVLWVARDAVQVPVGCVSIRLISEGA